MGIAFSHLIPRQLEAHGLTKAQMEVSPMPSAGSSPPIPGRRGCATWSGRSPRCAGVWPGKSPRVAASRCRSVKGTSPPIWDRPGSSGTRPWTTPSPEWPRAWPGPPPAAISSSLRPCGCRASGSLKLTGQLGDVMKESATAALSYIRARAPFLGIEETSSRGLTSTSMCPPGPSPRMGPPPGWPCCAPWSRSSPAGR